MTAPPRMRRFVGPIVRRLLHHYWRFSRGLTLGVRAIVIDGDGRLLLVRHTYVAGWHLPGGGVEPGETAVAALARELVEETGAEITAPPQLAGVYFNGHVSKRDHVLVYVVRGFRQPVPPPPNREIAALGFFALDALPNDTTAGSRARIAEIMLGTPARDRW
jgi:8-oxo-dGTP pyrophosphatase MutT (NUDIX family)